MNIPKQDLNLARKWRPKSFDTIIGQDITVRMLKNSLYVNKIFPVYLFAGQRGCGKTSTARIFATALNCAQLSTFQKEPTTSIPCLSCTSCTAMINGDHPDFIEIDAASHTGVDNVRQIIESSNYMPLVGTKKIYLIDEAHMLSKAAFNAFLKVLEEPPMSIAFVLATTEIHKIPQTVLSRCFQLIFTPIAATPLKAHLQAICTKENVVIDDAALDILLDETEGSARDAINLLERIRFSGDQITEQTILSVLGKISLQELFTLLDLIVDQKAPELLIHLQTINFEQRSPQLLWDMIIQYCRALTWIKYGVTTLPAGIGKHHDELKSIASKCSINRLNAILTLLWAQEELFMRTNKKHLFLEMVLMQLCQQVNALDLEELIKTCNTKGPPPNIHAQQPQQQSAPKLGPTQLAAEPQAPLKPTELATLAPDNQAAPAAQPATVTNNPTAWNSFLHDLTQCNDALLQSILKQAVFIGQNEATHTIELQLSADSTFFKNKLTEAKPAWQPLLAKHFEGYTDFTFAATAPTAIKPPEQPKIVRPQASPPSVTIRHTASVKESEFFNIKDPAQWPTASLIMRYFSGKLKKIRN